MNGTDQTSLLHFMETGIISETKIKYTRRIVLTSRVFATANACEKIIELLLLFSFFCKWFNFSMALFTSGRNITMEVYKCKIHKPTTLR